VSERSRLVTFVTIAISRMDRLFKQGQTMLTEHTMTRDGMDEEACWAAVQARDDRAAGAFVFAVVTTGIFCRPSCPARRAKRENLRFFRTSDEARRAGFRPCKRCAPDSLSLEGRHAETVADVCRRIESAETMPSLAELARAAGLSRFHLHRLFKRMTGLTPKAYADGVRAQRLRGELSVARSVTDAIYGAGYASSSRFYDHADSILGMEPRQYRAGGEGVSMVYAIETCWLGRVLIGVTDRGVCAILFGEDESALLDDLRGRFPRATVARAGRDHAQRIREVLAAIREPGLASGLPVDIVGTAFQQKIWTALRQIPHGETATYSEIARRIGAPDAARAVAGACAANPIAVAIPCHRVVRADGALAGYRWGVERKQKLLAREADKARRKR